MMNYKTNKEGYLARAEFHFNSRSQVSGSSECSLSCAEKGDSLQLPVDLRRKCSCFVLLLWVVWFQKHLEDQVLVRSGLVLVHRTLVVRNSELFKSFLALRCRATSIWIGFRKLCSDKHVREFFVECLQIFGVRFFKEALLVPGCSLQEESVDVYTLCRRFDVLFTQTSQLSRRDYVLLDYC